MLKSFSDRGNQDPIQRAQEHLALLGYGGMIIPHRDSFQNPALSNHFNHLEALFGFTGSAGFGVLMGQNAALFVDGRYVLECQKLQSSRFKILLWTEENLKAFFNARSQFEDTCLVGYDSDLVTRKFLDQLKELCKDTGVTLSKIDPNPMDSLCYISSHKGDETGAPIFYTQGEADRSFMDKCEAIGQEIAKKGVDAFLVSSPESLNWLLNMRGDDLPYTPLFLSIGLIYSDGRVKVFSNRDIPSEVQRHWGKNVVFFSYKEIKKTLKKIQGAIGMDPSYTSDALVSFMEEGGCSITRMEDPCILPKAIRGVLGCAQVAEAHKRDGAALVGIFKELLAPDRDRRSLSESEFASMIDASRYSLSLYVSPSFGTIVGFGANGAIIHYRPKSGDDKLLDKSDLVLVDSGAQYLDGTTDVTRTLWVGERQPPSEIVQAYTLVLKGHIALARVKFPKGTSGAQLDGLARQFLWGKGFDYAHGTGHGVGQFMNVHEGPQGVSQKGSRVPLSPGMVISNEPGYYKENSFGIRLENLMLVETSVYENFYQFKTLTLVPYQRCLIDLDLLIPEEVKWVNTYHEVVRETLNPLLVKTEQEWLEEQTKPL